MNQKTVKKVKCHKCKFETTPKGIGRHFKDKHNTKLSENLKEYESYFEYNNPGLIKKIIYKCEKEGYGLTGISKLKGFERIGEGSKLTIRKFIEPKLKISKEERTKLECKRRKKTHLRKYGKPFSDKFINNISSFKKNPNLAKKASLLAKKNPNIIKIQQDAAIRFKSVKFKKLRKEQLKKKYGKLCIVTSQWHKNIKKILNESGIKTKSEQNLIGNYVTDEYDINNNVCIELMGDFWHCNPKIYESTYYHPIIKITAKEIWSKDLKRVNEHKKEGYDVFLIWESDNIDDKIKEYKTLYG